jgi:formate dehydrogenase assembly factor FdhD
VPEVTDVAISGPTRDAVRAALPAGLNLISRATGDDPCIVETWL